MGEFRIFCHSAWGRDWRVFHPDHFDGAVAVFTGNIWECCQFAREHGALAGD